MIKTALLSLLMAFSISVGTAQHLFKAKVVDKDNQEPIYGLSAMISCSKSGNVTEADGSLLITNIPEGKHIIEFRYVGYITKKVTLQFPLIGDSVVLVQMAKQIEELNQVVVSTARSSRTIEDIPDRIEVISTEELEEKANMRPADLRMLLMESTGIQVQQTSAVSANANFRIQGLDGRYTQLLKDGFPLYSGFSGGLSIMQIPPLDLQRVEIIKGAASTLYGGGAIAGLINLISKSPSDEPELSFMINGTSALGLDVSGFTSGKKNKLGWTIFASHHRNEAYDPAGIGFSAIPELQRFVLNPRLFIDLSANTKINFGVNLSHEDRLGGDMNYISGADQDNTFFEHNQSLRASTQLGISHLFSEKRQLIFKNSVNAFDREINIPNYVFAGVQWASFSELAYHAQGTKTDFSVGFNVWTEQFEERMAMAGQQRDLSFNTYGLFFQNTWYVNSQWTVEAGLRTDWVQPAPLSELEGLFILPRVNFMYKPMKELTFRLGGGQGYKSPSIFSEEAENLAFRNILPMNFTATKAEESIGGNFDINYRQFIGDDWVITLNHLFFYTQLSNTLMLQQEEGNLYGFVNLDGRVRARGTETNVKISYDDLALFVGYTLTDAQRMENGNTEVIPLNARHRINSVLMFEEDDNFRLGLEAHFFGKQQLTDGSMGRSYVSLGFMAEKIWERFSLFINFENLLDARQTRFGQLYTGTSANPRFQEIYAPLDGRIINGGIKLKFGE